MPMLADLMGAQRGAAPITLASLGQRYQNYPAATFDQRFGPYKASPGLSEQDILRLFLEQQQLGRDPSVIVPGSKSFPFGYTRI